MRISDYDADFAVEEYGAAVELTVEREGEVSRYELTPAEARELADLLQQVAAEAAGQA